MGKRGGRMELKGLALIQSKLKSPKTRHNNFGNYDYRSCEDILDAVKPLLKEAGCTLTLSDDMVLIGERYYIVSTATLTENGGREFKVKAFAREPLSKKGMDDSQITGSASSYARKYALNGLFCIDDARDADVEDSDDTLQIAISEIKAAKSIATLTSVYNNYKQSLGDNPDFLARLTERKNQLNNETK